MRLAAAGTLVAFVVSLGCKGHEKAATGAGIGAAGGAVVGAAVGSRFKKTGTGAILGAVVGGTAGAAIGHYMDKQAAELQRDLGDAVRVKRVGEGIQLTFANEILFAFDSDQLQAGASEDLAKLADVLRKYKDTELLIEGYTDSIGADAYNEDLSRRRAEAVASVLRDNEVNVDRLALAGRGETNPVASNQTSSGRTANRRVEVQIIASEKLKQAALKNEELRVAETERRGRM